MRAHQGEETLVPLLRWHDHDARPAFETPEIEREVRRRVVVLLKKLEGAKPSPKTIRTLRAVEVLEKIGTEPARQLLQKLAAGAPAARVTREAAAAAKRLTKGD